MDYTYLNFWFEDSVLINKPNSYVKHLNVDNKKFLKKSCI